MSELCFKRSPVIMALSIYPVVVNLSPSSRMQGVSADHKTTASTHAADPKDPHGFKNYGQYVAAQHVAENLQIPGGIDALKAMMTGDNAISLGKAIAQLRPDLSQQSIDVEVKKAEAEAKKMQKGTK